MATVAVISFGKVKSPFQALLNEFRSRQNIASFTQSATVTITIAAPGVITDTAHGLPTGAQIKLSTSGTLPTGLVAATVYFVIPIDANSYNLSTTLSGALNGVPITTSGSQSGTQTRTTVGALSSDTAHDGETAVVGNAGTSMISAAVGSAPDATATASNSVTSAPIPVPAGGVVLILCHTGDYVSVAALP
jgi:hypothetical protein